MPPHFPGRLRRLAAMAIVCYRDRLAADADDERVIGGADAGDAVARREAAKRLVESGLHLVAGCDQAKHVRDGGATRDGMPIAGGEVSGDAAGAAEEAIRHAHAVAGEIEMGVSDMAVGGELALHLGVEGGGGERVLPVGDDSDVRGRGLYGVIERGAQGGVHDGMYGGADDERPGAQHRPGEDEQDDEEDDQPARPAARATRRWAASVGPARGRGHGGWGVGRSLGGRVDGLGAGGIRRWGIGECDVGGDGVNGGGNGWVERAQGPAAAAAHAGGGFVSPATTGAYK